MGLMFENATVRNRLFIGAAAGTVVGTQHDTGTSDNDTSDQTLHWYSLEVLYLYLTYFTEYRVHSTEYSPFL